ncbi:MAG: MHYT domain-containing protein, partial [Actinomycetes bacterium]
FLLLAGVVVMFDPLVVMGKPDVTRVDRKPGVPAGIMAHPGRRPPLEPARSQGDRAFRTPQNR